MSEFFEFQGEQVFMHHTLDRKPNPGDFRMHTHTEYEFCYFMGGRGGCYVEGTLYTLQSGDILITNSAESHYTDIDPSMPYERCAVRFRPELLRTLDPEGLLTAPFENRPIGKRNLIRRECFESDLYRRLLENMTCETDNRELQIIANLPPLLNEIRLAFYAGEDTATSESQINRILHYINQRLHQPPSLDELCEMFYISKSQLCRLFKKTTGSTVWDYITVKRLMSAQKQIEAGISPTKIYTACGYTDYSVFYRSYQKYFGRSPKADFERFKK